DSLRDERMRRAADRSHAARRRHGAALGAVESRRGGFAAPRVGLRQARLTRRRARGEPQNERTRRGVRTIKRFGGIVVARRRSEYTPPIAGLAHAIREPALLRPGFHQSL